MTDRKQRLSVIGNCVLMAQCGDSGGWKQTSALHLGRDSDRSQANGQNMLAFSFSKYFEYLLHAKYSAKSLWGHKINNSQGH